MFLADIFSWFIISYIYIQKDEINGDQGHNKSADKNVAASKEGKLPVSHEQWQRVAETETDTLDIAGMDYSQARRKPPIHN